MRDERYRMGWAEAAVWIAIILGVTVYQIAKVSHGGQP